jgi:hypothetical protein
MQRPRFRRFSGVEERNLVLLAGNCNAADFPASSTEEAAEALSDSHWLSNRFIVSSGYGISAEAGMNQVWILEGDLIGG